MPDFAGWLKQQDSSADPELRALQNFAQSNAATWPYDSNDLKAYTSEIASLPPGSQRDQLIQALGRYYERWTLQSKQPYSGSGLLDRMTRNAGMLFLSAAGLAIVALVAIGLFSPGFFTSIAKPDQARGLITFLFAFSTTAIIVLVAVTTFWVDIDEVEARFEKAKDLITVIIGVLGTILGFYFGSELASREPPAQNETEQR